MLAANTAKIMTSAYTVYIGIDALPVPHISEGLPGLLVGRGFCYPSPPHQLTTTKRKDSKQIRAWGPHNSDAHLARATEGVGGWGRRPVSAKQISVGRSNTMRITY